MGNTVAAYAECASALNELSSLGESGGSVVTYTWLEDYLERLEVKEACSEFQGCCSDKYQTLLASLLA
jgi:hypothetical protein